MLSVVVPFDSFHASVHEDTITREIESMVSDSQGTPRDSLVNEMNGCVRYRRVYREYAKEYVNRFAVEFEILSLSFDTMVYPREYNFESDRIIAEISEDDVRAMYERADKELLRKVVHDALKPVSGFAPYFSNDLDDWETDPTVWGEARLGLLLEVVARQDSPNKTFDADDQLALMESAMCNGRIADWIYESEKKGVDRILKIAGYLNTRDGR